VTIQSERIDEEEKHAVPEKKGRPVWPWVLLVAALAVAAALYFAPGRRSEKAPAKGAPPTSVLAVPAGTGDIDVYQNGLGTVIPLNTVTIRSRVDGQLMEVRFREGQKVNRGDLLAVIDPRPFQVQLAQAEGQLAKDREQLRNARLDLARYQDLWSKDSIQKQQVDTQESLVHQLEAALKIDQGQVDNARLQLVYCRITAPVGGRVGLRQVDVGNMVRATDANGLVVLTQMQPAGVVFPIAEDHLPMVLAKIRGGARLSVDAYDRDNRQRLAVGQLSTVDNQIDPATGTVKLKALFENKSDELFPNQFVNARLLLETRKGVVTVPSSAVQRGPQGTFLYLVRPDRTVAVRPVVLGESEGDVTQVAQGLKPGELVVVEGAERLREGSKVVLREAGAPSARHGAPAAGSAGQPAHPVRPQPLPSAPTPATPGTAPPAAAVPAGQGGPVGR